MEYTVVIEKRHCEGRRYMSVKDCPLCAAIRDQFPNFPLHSVGGDLVRDEKYGEWKFNASTGSGWSAIKMYEIVDGETSSHSVTFRLVEEVPKPKEVIRYVSVPESIEEQKEELILN